MSELFGSRTGLYNKQPCSSHWEKLFYKSVLSPRRVSGGRIQQDRSQPGLSHP